MERKEHSKGERTGAQPQYSDHLSQNTCIPGDKLLPTAVRGRQENLSPSENGHLSLERTTGTCAKCRD